jgi:leucyl aminopeptidase
MTTLTLTTADPTTVKADAVVIGIAPAAVPAGKAAKAPAPPRLLAGSDKVDAAFGGRLARILTELGATGKAGEVTRLASLGATTAPVIVAVGLGPDDHAVGAVRGAAAAAARALRGAGTVVLALPTADRVALAAQVEGALLGGYSFTTFRHTSLAGHRAAIREVRVTVAGAKDKAAAAALHRGQVLAEAVTLVRDLVNTPPGHLPPAELAARAKKAAEAAGCTVEVFEEKALAKAGYGGLLGVGSGSVRPPRLVKISYRPGRTARHVALVGKGITFDSGGLSLKPPVSMESMKSDMAGAASVLAAVIAAARLKGPVAVTAWLACAENMPSGTAIRPGDVLDMYGGTRVEVLNTDAEGRLVLADALVRAAEDGPDAVIDIATLTGAQVVALGSRVGGLMSNDDALRGRVAGAADTAGESFWPMPLPEQLREKLDSPVADIANVQASGGREAGMLVAGVFLSTFVPDGLPWAHLDIAGPSWHVGEPYADVNKGGTGFGVRTLLATVESFA